MKTFKVNINLSILKWVRESSGYSIEEFSHMIGFIPEKYIKVERGEIKLTWAQLRSISKRTRYPLPLFYLNSPPKTIRKPRDFRTYDKGGTVGSFSPGVLTAIREARLIRDNTISLCNILDNSINKCNLPKINIKDNPTKCAQIIREFLDIPLEKQLKWKDVYEALYAWRDIFFRINILVIQINFKDSDIRGMCEHYDDMSLIALSSSEPEPKAKIFSLFHEFVHLCLNYPGISSNIKYNNPIEGPRFLIELFCDKVAGEILIPYYLDNVNDMINMVNKNNQIDKEHLKYVSDKLKVSQTAILVSMVNNKLISWSTYNEIIEDWNKIPLSKGKVKILPSVRKISKYGKNYTSLVIEALNTGKLTLHDACSYLDTSSRWVNDINNKGIRI